MLGGYKVGGCRLTAGGGDGRKVVFPADGPGGARGRRDSLRLTSLAHHQSWSSASAAAKAKPEEGTTAPAARPSL